MRLDFRLQGAWADMNAQIAANLRLDADKTAVRVYQGLGHGLVEVALGLTKLYPLKKKIYYFKNMDPSFEAALMPLAKEGYKIVPLELTTLADPTDWLATLEREDLFILYSADDPILGRYYDVEKFENALKDKPLFKIRLSHARHFYEGRAFADNILDRNSAHIYALSAESSLAVLGERGKTSPIVTHQLPLQSPADLEWFYTPYPLKKDKVVAFEAQGIADAKAYFKPDELRAPDRAVIYWEDMDGYAVIDRLSQELGLELKAPGQESLLETTSLSRWGGVRTMDFLVASGLSANQIRGLVLLSHTLLDDPQFAEKLLRVRRSILEDQFGPDLAMRGAP